jgi:hypothetical protein
MGGAVKSVTKPFIEGVQKVAGSLTGNKTAEAAAPAPATPVAPAEAPAPALAPQEAVIQRRKRGRASSLLSDSASAPQTASKALLGQ